MSKEKEIIDIISLYDSILESKSINELSDASNELFGGADVTIPRDGAHGGQSGWQSANAWDIKAPIGSPVYAVIGGTVRTYTDYGSNPISKDGKTLFGVGFTVDSDDNLPDVYYTHLKNAKVSQGDKITCGQLLGYVMDFPGNDYDHLHIGVETGNIKQFLNDNGTLKCANGQSIGGSSDKAYNDATKTASKPKSSNPFNASGVEKDDFLTTIAKGLASKFIKTESIQEQKNFGKDISNRYGRIIIPKDSNPKIKSPISGVIYNKRYSSSCVNQVTILNTDNQKIYIQFCGISSPKVRDGQSILVGDTLGNTDSDVEVTMYDSSWGRIPIGSEGINKYTEKKKDDKEKSNKKDDTNKYYDDPLTAIAAGVPGKILNKIFGDKYDEKTGERTQKRWGGVADKQPVDPWLLDLIKSPFKTKKVTENIERIKKLL